MGYFIHKARIEFQAAFTVCTLFPFAPHAGAGHFLSLRRQRKEAKESDCGHRFGSAKLPSLRTVFRAGSQLAAAPLRTCKPLFPEKPHSVRLRQQRKCSCNHSCQIFCASLSRKFNDECSLFVWHNQPHIAAAAAFFPP